jgi:probable HAF family extracellular repeat protein
MRFMTATCIGMTALFAAAASPLQLSARGLQTHDGHHAQYSVVILRNLSGGSSFANGINNRDWATGYAFLSGGQQHAVLWTTKRPKDLGTLGGPNSSVDWPVKSDRGDVVGISETSATDPYAENFCGYGTPNICVGFIWQQGQGQMSALPTLGGNNALAAAVNNEGQIVGLSENATQDPSCTAPQVFDVEGVEWGPAPSQIQELPPLAGDTIGAAVAINNRGQAVGASGPTCGPVSTALALHALVWRNGKPVSLPTLGGAMNNYGAAISDRDEIAGSSDLPSDVTTHAVFWKTTKKVTDLGVLSGDYASYAFGMNNGGQIVGTSCTQGSASCRAFVYEDGTMIDFNTLVPQSSHYYLTQASDINDNGEITGDAYDTSTGAVVGFVAIPTDRAAIRGGTSVPRVVLPDNVRRLLQRRTFARFGRAF